jgi:hypothetical protein
VTTVARWATPWIAAALWLGCGGGTFHPAGMEETSDGPPPADTAVKPPPADAAKQSPADAAPPAPDSPAADRAPLAADGATEGPGPTPVAGWWDPRWRGRRPVTVVHPGKEDLVDFVVPVTLPPETGDDLRFVDGDGAVLAHEREGALAWVRAPRLAAGASGVAFWMYGRNPTPPPAAPAEVWTAPHAAVWHFGGDAKDATRNHADGAETQVRFVAGTLGMAAAFDSTRREHISLVTNSKLVSGAAAATVSAWVQHAGEVHDGQDIILGIGTADTGGHLSRVSVALSPSFGLIGEANPDEGAWDVIDSPANTVPNAQWHHLAVVIDVRAKTIQLYKNGTPLRAPFRGRWTAAAYAATPANRVTIGCEEDESKSFFTGLIDELRVDTTARSAEWLAAESRAPKMATAGAEERLP